MNILNDVCISSEYALLQRVCYERGISLYDYKKISNECFTYLDFLRLKLGEGENIPSRYSVFVNPLDKTFTISMRSLQIVRDCFSEKDQEDLSHVDFLLSLSMIDLYKMYYFLPEDSEYVVSRFYDMLGKSFESALFYVSDSLRSDREERVYLKYLSDILKSGLSIDNWSNFFKLDAKSCGKFVCMC